MITIEELKSILLETDINKLEMALQNYNIHETDKFGNNILHYYIKSTGSFNLDYKQVIDLFLQKGIDINQKQTTGTYKRSPLHLSVFMKLKDITEYLIELKADINSTDANGNSILSTAIITYRGDESYFIEKLIESGADINVKNNYGVSPLELAETIANYDVKKFFI